MSSVKLGPVLAKAFLELVRHIHVSIKKWANLWTYVKLNLFKVRSRVRVNLKSYRC